MTLIFRVFLLLLVLPHFAVAAPPVPTPALPTTIISYYQFMELKKSEQAKYLLHLRDVLHQAEIIGEQRFVRSKKVAAVDSFLVFLLQETAVAANEPCVQPINSFIVVKGEVMNVRACLQKTGCRQGQEEVPYPTPIDAVEPTPDRWAYCAYPRSAKPIKRIKPDMSTPQSLIDAKNWDLDKPETKKENAPLVAQGKIPIPVARPNTEIATADAEAAPEVMDVGAKVISKSADAKDSEAVCGSVKCETSSKARLAARTAFQERTDGINNGCIMAGTPSSYNSSTKRCQKVALWKMGSKSFKCTSGQTMCNPLLFGVKKDGEALCVPVQGGATIACHELSEKLGAKSANALNFLNQPKEPLTTEDLEESWNLMRVQLAELCREKISAAYHCVECGLLWTRLREMNKVSACADTCGRTGEETCRGRIQKFNGDASSTKGKN